MNRVFQRFSLTFIVCSALIAKSAEGFPHFSDQEYYGFEPRDSLYKKKPQGGIEVLTDIFNGTTEAPVEIGTSIYPRVKLCKLCRQCWQCEEKIRKKFNFDPPKGLLSDSDALVVHSAKGWDVEEQTKVFLKWHLAKVIHRLGVCPMRFAFDNRTCRIVTSWQRGSRDACDCHPAPNSFQIYYHSISEWFATDELRISGCPREDRGPCTITVPAIRTPIFIWDKAVPILLPRYAETKHDVFIPSFNLTVYTEAVANGMTNGGPPYSIIEMFYAFKASDVARALTFIFDNLRTDSEYGNRRVQALRYLLLDELKSFGRFCYVLEGQAQKEWPFDDYMAMNKLK